MTAHGLPFSEEELSKVGLLGVSEFTKLVMETMKKHPDLLKLSIFALECISSQGEQVQNPGSPSSARSSSSRGDSPLVSHVPALSKTSEATAVSPYAPDEYERKSYYNGITSDGDHPILVYRSDYQSTPFPKPSGRYAHLAVKTLRGVFDTPLNKAWPIVGPGICDILKGFNLHRWSVDPARFFTHSNVEREEQGTLGPVVVWIGVPPGSTTPETAHEISQEILALLNKNDVHDVVVEFREAETQRLVGRPLLRHVGITNATHHVRRFLTPLLGVPLTTTDLYEQDGQGTLTLWFHENIDKGGNASDRVFGLTCCHVLRRETTTKYELRGGAAKNFVRVCGLRRFQSGLDDIVKAISDHGILAEYFARDIAALQAKGEQDTETKRELRRLEAKLEEKYEALEALEALYVEITQQWSNIKLQRNIGYVTYAPAVCVANDTRDTSDWGVFVAAEAKVRPGFEGNVVDLGSKYPPQDLVSMFYPGPSSQSTFKLPDERKLRIVDCATEDDLANPAQYDAEGQRCLMLGKAGNTTGLTVGRYAGIVSFVENDSGVVSRELGIYNSGLNVAEPFSGKGDSGSLVWYICDGKAHMVGQIHSGRNKGASSSNHITYATPAWYLLQQVKAKYNSADFYRTKW